MTRNESINLNWQNKNVYDIFFSNGETTWSKQHFRLCYVLIERISGVWMNIMPFNCFIRDTWVGIKTGKSLIYCTSRHIFCTRKQCSNREFPCTCTTKHLYFIMYIWQVNTGYFTSLQHASILCYYYYPKIDHIKRYVN